MTARTFRAGVPITDAHAPVGELLAEAQRVGRWWVDRLGWEPTCPPRVWLHDSGRLIVVEVRARPRPAQRVVSARQAYLERINAEALRIRTETA